MAKKAREIPDWEDGNPLMSIGSLLLDARISVATLATAIEKKGIYTWDRFGRFGLADNASKERALAVLALQYASEEEQSAGAYIQTAVEKNIGSGDSAFDLFGWAKEVLPDFAKIHAEQIEVPQSRVVAIRRKAPDAFVAALVRLLVEIAKRDREIDIEKMPGTKLDLLELAMKFDSNLEHPISTFDTYIESLCKFKRGSRSDSFYRDLFPEYFK